MTHIAVAGRSGFLGSAVRGALEADGRPTMGIPAPRLQSDPRSIDATATEWCRAGNETAAATAELLSECSTLVIASGLAASSSDATTELFGANAASPLALCMLAARAGIQRVVHVSSAAVQGRRDPLDETEDVEPFSPYSASKAAGEQAVRRECDHLGLVLSIYRPTSVQGYTRPVTRQLVRLASLPVRPRPGSAPVPLALVENCAAAVAHLVGQSAAGSGIFLHPWEGVTGAGVFELLGGSRHRFPVPASMIGTLTPSLLRLGKDRPSLTSRIRQLELLFVGQRQAAHALEASGFRPPIGLDGYVRLAEQVRSSAEPQAAP